MDAGEMPNSVVAPGMGGSSTNDGQRQEECTLPTPSTVETPRSYHESHDVETSTTNQVNPSRLSTNSERPFLFPSSLRWALKSSAFAKRRIQTGLLIVLMFVVGISVGIAVAFAKNHSKQSIHTSNYSSLVGDISGISSDGGFGSAIFMNRDGTRVAVGASSEWEGTGENGGFLLRGVVVVYEVREGQWLPLGQEIRTSATEAKIDLLIPSPEIRNKLVVSLSSDGSCVAVGAPFHDIRGGKNIGQVEIFKLISDSWVRMGDVILGDASGDYSGASVSLSADCSAVAFGAPRYQWYQAGRVKVFHFNAGGWQQRGQSIDGTVVTESIGSSVSMSKDATYLAIGSCSRIEKGNRPGVRDFVFPVVRVYEYQEGDWVELGSGIYGGQGLYATRYNVELSSDGKTVVMSNYYADENGPDVAAGEANDSLFAAAFRFVAGEWAQLGGNMHHNVVGDKSGYFISLSDDGTLIGMGDPGRSGKGGTISC